MNPLKQSFKFCCFLRKGLCYKLYLVASTNSFILLEMPAMAWSYMCVHVKKKFPFVHWDSKTQQWECLNCWFYFLKIKEKIMLKTAHSQARFPPGLNYTLSTGKNKNNNPLSTLLFMEASVHLSDGGSDTGSLHFAPISCSVPKKNRKGWFLYSESQALEIQRSISGSQLAFKLCLT